MTTTHPTDHEGHDTVTTTDPNSLINHAVRRAASGLSDLDVQKVEIVKRPATLSDAATKVLESVGMLAVGAWELMLLAGAIHHHLPAVPVIGYWTAVWVLMAVGTLGYAAGLRPIPVRQLERPKRKSR